MLNPTCSLIDAHLILQQSLPPDDVYRATQCMTYIRTVTVKAQLEDQAHAGL